MENLNNLVSLQLERTFLGGLINLQDTFSQIDTFLSEKDFSNVVHSTIYSIIRQSLSKAEKIDKIIIAQRIKELGINFKDSLDIFDYLDDLSYTKISQAGIISAAKELIKLRIRRELVKNAEEVKGFVLENPEKSVTDLVSGVDKIYNEKVNLYYNNDDEPQDLFKDIENLIDERVKNPNILTGYYTHFKIYNEMFGPLRKGITSFCGRAKHNKSTFLLNLGWGTILNNPNLKILYLDTELKKEDHQFRAMGAFSQMNPFYLEDGSWSKNKELVNKLGGSWDKIKNLRGNFYHKYIGNKSIEEVCSIARRWYYNVCGRGNPAIVILDYIKIGDEKLSNFNGEHQELGRKINSLNAMSQDLEVPVISSMQLNRSAIVDQREDESAISMTDRLSWFSNGVCIFRKKRPDEIAEEGLNFGTHKLIPVVSRYQGKQTNHFDLVRTIGHSGKTIYKQNFINYNFSHFLLEERGTYCDIIEYQNLNHNLQKDDTKNKDGSINL